MTKRKNCSNSVSAMHVVITFQFLFNSFILLNGKNYCQVIKTVKVKHMDFSTSNINVLIKMNFESDDFKIKSFSLSLRIKKRSVGLYLQHAYFPQNFLNPILNNI